MDWYGRRMEASAFGHQMFSHTGEGGTYYDLGHAESMKELAEYRARYLLQGCEASGSTQTIDERRG